MADQPQRTLRCLLPRTPLMLVVGWCLMLPATAVHALAFGQPQGAPVLGQPLQFTLPVHLAAGERLEAGCIRADVRVGDRPLPAYEIRLSVQPGRADDERLLRVATLGGVDEPWVAVQIDTACGQDPGRRYMLLSQPANAAPVPTAEATPMAVAHRTRPAAGSRLALDRAALALGLGATLVAPWAGAGPAVRADAALQAMVAQAAVQVAGDQIKALEQQVQMALAEARRQQDQLGQLRQRLGAAEAANRWLPWLLLGLVVTGALALWLALRVRRLQAEHRRQAWSHPAGTPPGEADAAPSGPVSLLSPDQPLLSRAGDGAGEGPGAATQPALTVAHPSIAAVAATTGRADGAGQVADFSLGSGVPPRPVSVEELLDLDQQVDFFLVLGQEHAAVELLLSHVRSTGGTSALPYFKLLDIYRQQGDEEAYERTRERFNQRFNAHAPDWSGSLAAGRRLEDYPDVVQRLQRAWPQPLRAVAELESLLLRRADLEPFDMPAYREVLMLHALVRDLPAAPVAAGAAGALQPMAPAAAPPTVDFVVDASGVDVLLPLDDNARALDITEPRPHLADRVSAQSMLAGWVFTRNADFERSAGAPAQPGLAPDTGRPSLKVDLDLNDFAPAPREFTRPAAFTDIDHRRDSRLSDLAAFDDSDLLPPSITRH